jgi:hypothetical protein
VTPAEAETYFEGSWDGEGQIIGRGLLRWLMRREPFRLTVRMERLSDSIWVFRDHLIFERGGEIRRTQFMERVGVGRYRATADDMPLGADVVVDGRLYRYETYRSWTCFRGRMVRVRAREDGALLEDGSIEGVIRVWWHGIPLSRTALRLRRAR